jgi:hypothetical protein
MIRAYVQPIFLLLALSVGLVSCAEKTSVNRSSSNDTNPPSSDDRQNQTPSDQTIPCIQGGLCNGSEDGIADAGQTINYRTISNIIVHGNQNPNRHRCGNVFNGVTATAPNCYNPNFLWSSAVDLPSANQHIFSTDRRFNLRVIPRSGPNQNRKDVKDIECRHANDLYTELELEVCVRGASETCNNFNTVTFNGVKVNVASLIKEFPVPVTMDPLVVEVRDISWDYTCKAYGNDPTYCPYASVWDTQCVRFDIQFSTDETKDIPGQRL